VNADSPEDRIDRISAGVKREYGDAIISIRTGARPYLVFQAQAGLG